MTDTHTFGDISHESMRNASGFGQVNNSITWQIDYFSSWNNTAKEWVNANFDLSWENTTQLGRNTNTSLDAVWFWSNNYNLTYNSSVDYITNSTPTLT